MRRRRRQRRISGIYSLSPPRYTTPVSKFTRPEPVRPLFFKITTLYNRSHIYVLLIVSGKLWRDLVKSYWRSMTKIAGSGFASGSGSISQRHGSPDPDPHQNVMDPEHWKKLCPPSSLAWCWQQTPAAQRSPCAWSWRSCPSWSAGSPAWWWWSPGSRATPGQRSGWSCSNATLRS